MVLVDAFNFDAFIEFPLAIYEVEKLVSCSVAVLVMGQVLWALWRRICQGVVPLFAKPVISRTGVVHA